MSSKFPVGQTSRDPAVGSAMLAFYALVHGDEPVECAGDFVQNARERLLAIVSGRETPTSDELRSFLSDVALVLIGFEQALDPNATSTMKLELSRRKRGQPVNRQERSRRGNRAAAIAEGEIEAGVKTEAAVAKATEETGLSRAEVFAWMRHRREITTLPARSWQKDE